MRCDGVARPCHDEGIPPKLNVQNRAFKPRRLIHCVPVLTCMRSATNLVQAWPCYSSTCLPYRTTGVWAACPWMCFVVSAFLCAAHHQEQLFQKFFFPFRFCMWRSILNRFCLTAWRRHTTRKTCRAGDESLTSIAKRVKCFVTRHKNLILFVS